MIHVRLSADMEKGAPGLQRGVRLRAGQLFAIEGLINYPGEVQGPITRTQWAFWQDYDIDCSLIFNLYDISEIVVTHDDPRLELVKTAPVPVTILPTS